MPSTGGPGSDAIGAGAFAFAEGQCGCGDASWSSQATLT